MSMNKVMEEYKQTNIKSSYNSLPANSIASVSKVLYDGNLKYGENNWKTIPIKEHINHALYHIFRYMDRPNIEDMSHACCRVLFALSLILDDAYNDIFDEDQ